MPSPGSSSHCTPPSPAPIVGSSGAAKAGAGSALLAELARRARAAGVRRIWLVTTNDNAAALRFYQRRGLDLVALHRGAVTAARRLKPSIPAEIDGIAVRHELELEWLL